jgi:hypothetical protein
MSMCYKRLAVVVLFLPCMSAISPVVWNTFFTAINLISGGFGVVCIVMTIVFCTVWYLILKCVAPNPDKLQDAYAKSKLLLPLLLFLLTCGLVRVVARLTNVHESISLQCNLTISWGIGLRPAFGFILMGVALLLRFVGRGSYGKLECRSRFVMSSNGQTHHVSIVRCSTVPLVSNEYANVLRAKISEIYSYWYYIRVRPTNRSDPNAPQNTWVRKCGRRYQFPTLWSYVVNLICTLILGLLVAETVLVPGWKALQTDRLSYDEAKRSRSLIDCSCFATMIVHLVVGSANEINPRKYYKQMTASYLPVGGALLKESLFRVAISTAATLVTLISIVAGTGPDFHATLGENTWLLILFCTFSSAAVGFYMTALEEAAKAALCAPGANLKRFVQEITVGGEEKVKSGGIAMEDEDSYMVDVMLHSILHGDTALVREVSRRAMSSWANNKLQHVEADGNRRAVLLMSRVLLGVGDSFRAVEASLEEDMLRHSILESLGGSPFRDTTTTSNKKSENAISSSALVVHGTDEQFPMASRHMETIAYWIEDPFAIRRPHSGMVEAKALPLIRALCAYAGGLGRALVDCRDWGSPQSTWIVRPGALLAAEYSVIALARCIEKIFFNAKARATDWNQSHAALLIPATLNSAYCLHNGVIQYARHLDQVSARIMFVQGVNFETTTMAPQKTNAEVMKDHPDLNQVLFAVQHAAKVIMQEVKLATRSGLGATTLRNDLDEGCEQWLQFISSTQTTG